jgi:hypothetical protein
VSSRLAAGFSYDPMYGSLGFREILENGGKEFNPARPAVWDMPCSKIPWKFCYLVGTDPADIRQQYCANFNCVANNVAGADDTKLCAYGTLTVHWDVSFRKPADSTRDDAAESAAALAFALSLRKKRLEHKKEQQEEKCESPVLIPSNLTRDLDQPGTRVTEQSSLSSVTSQKGVIVGKPPVRGVR